MKYIMYALIVLVYFIIMINYLINIFNNKPIRKCFINSIITYFLFVISIYLLGIFMTPPIIELKGDSIVTINVFDEYIDSGYDLNYFNKKLDVDVSSDVDSNVVGIYNVKYTVKHNLKEITRVRKVKVVDNISPKITLNGKSEINVHVGNKFNEPGYSAIDNYDGDITDKVVVTNNIKDEVGSYEIIYTVTDSSGNKDEVKRVVNKIVSNNGIIYLTFDDGPSSNTLKILDILKKENIKATFFIVNYNSSYDSVIKRIVDEGHTLGLHSYTHNYKLIYSSVDAYFDDLNKLKDKVKKTTGIDSYIIRFPGGSSNTISRFNKGIMTKLVKEVKNRGYHYFDWNVDCMDAGGAKSSSDVYNNVMNKLIINGRNVVLMHDFGRTNITVNALSNIIVDAKKRGYSFSNITYDTPMVVHGVNN